MTNTPRGSRNTSPRAGILNSNRGSVKRVLPVAALVALVTSAVLVAGQQPTLPGEPQHQFGASVTPAFEGWFNNKDGSKSLLIGYFNRNLNEDIDVPIGPNNHFEPGPADRGQPTHFLAG